MMIRNLQFSGGYQYLQYIHFLLMEPEFGLMDNLMPQIMGNISQIIVMSRGDPDTPILNEAMTGTYKAVIMQDMNQDIKEMEQHGTWPTVFRKSVNGVQIVSSTWDFKVKRFSGGIPRKLKARFCARVHIQVEEVEYFEKYAPVVSWTTFRLILSLSINQGWATRQVDFYNDFVQATLLEDFCLTLPYYF